MAEPLCKVCADPLVAPVSDDDEPVPTSASSSSPTPNTIPDDLLFPCGCHYHWQCALDQATHIATHLTCPACDAYLVANAPGPSATNPIFAAPPSAPAILCRYESDGGVEPLYDALPVLTEEAYLAGAAPGARRARAFLALCGGGDVPGAVALLRDAAADAAAAGGAADAAVRAIVLGRDALARGRSALHIALERRREDVVWLLLWLASPRLPTAAFPDEAVAAAGRMGLDRMPAAAAGEDIVGVRDADGRSAEEYARAMAPVWDRLVQAGVLKL